MRLLLLALFALALPAQQLVIEAEYSRDPVRSYERMGDKHVFRCDGHRWMLPDIRWDMREGAPKTVLQLNEEGTFGCSFTIAGGYTCYLFTPVQDFLETLKTGQQCLKGQLEKTVARSRPDATITPGESTFSAPRDFFIRLERARDNGCEWVASVNDEDVYECSNSIIQLQ